MNRKQFFTLIVLAAIVGGLGLWYAKKRKENFGTSTFQSGQKVIHKFPVNDVSHLRIQQGTNEVNLVKAETWGVKERWNYPAEFSEISDFLRKIYELKPVQEVEVGSSQLGRLELVEPGQGGTNSATLVEFKDDKGANLTSILLGKKYTRQSAPGPFGGGGEFPVGRYVMVPGAQAKVWVVNETFSNVETRAEQWLEKDFLKVEKLKSVAVTHPEAANSWHVARETENGEWKLVDARQGENFDSAKASSLNYALSSPSFNDVAGQATEGNAVPEPTVAKLETFDGFIYTLQIGTKTNEDNVLLTVDVEGNFPKERTPGQDEKPEDKEKLDKEFREKMEKLQEKLRNEQQFEKWIYLVSKWTVDAFTKERKELMGDKKEEETEDAPTSSASAPPIETFPDELKDIPPIPAPPQNKAQAEEKAE